MPPMPTNIARTRTRRVPMLQLVQLDQLLPIDFLQIVPPIFKLLRCDSGLALPVDRTSDSPELRTWPEDVVWLRKMRPDVQDATSSPLVLYARATRVPFSNALEPPQNCVQKWPLTTPSVRYRKRCSCLSTTCLGPFRSSHSRCGDQQFLLTVTTLASSERGRRRRFALPPLGHFGSPCMFTLDLTAFSRTFVSWSSATSPCAAWMTSPMTAQATSSSSFSSIATSAPLGNLGRRGGHSLALGCRSKRRLGDCLRQL